MTGRIEKIAKSYVYFVGRIDERHMQNHYQNSDRDNGRGRLGMMHSVVVVTFNKSQGWGKAKAQDLKWTGLKS